MSSESVNYEDIYCAEDGENEMDIYKYTFIETIIFIQ